MKMTRKEFLELLALSAAGAGAGGLGLAAAEQPAEPAKPGSVRWGMVIDFRKCRWDRGCESCLKACRTAHNIPEIPDPAHAVKWIWKEHYENVFPFEQSDFTRGQYAGHPLDVLCNHCAQPACVRVCPTAATWKREDGVVMMDWHRCIGCRYCMAACPYGSRSFNWSDPRPYVQNPTTTFPTRMKGVVEKCNFCEERLAQGNPPACVAECPEKALTFGNLNDEHSPLRQLLRERYSLQRKPELGTSPSIFYLV